MPVRKLLALGLFVSLAASLAAADEVEYIRENGVDYRVTRRVVSRPMSTTKIAEKEQTVYREQYSTELQETTRIVTVPVTEYRWEAVWEGRWNPFVQPYLVQRLVPHTRLETRTEVVKVPVTRRELVPETRVVQVPVTERWMAQEEITHKVALDPLPSGAGETAVAQRPGVGGVAELKSDPPRNGSDTWRPGERTLR